MGGWGGAGGASGGFGGEGRRGVGGPGEEPEGCYWGDGEGPEGRSRPAGPEAGLRTLKGARRWARTGSRCGWGWAGGDAGAAGSGGL